MPDSIAERLATLPRLSKAALCDLWKQLFKTQPPCQTRRDVMVPILAWRIQEDTFGSLSFETRRRLHRLATTFEANPNATVSTQPPIKPGTRLVREWKEQVHVVEVEAKGYAYRGSRYENLSEIARLITGTRWSGPLFFGLKTKQSTESTRPNDH
jgi:hypothetical protein